MTEIPTGYLIGRAVERAGPGTWWEYVGTVATYEEAGQRASELARGDNCQVWFQKRGDTCTPYWRHHAAVF